MRTSPLAKLRRNQQRRDDGKGGDASGPASAVVDAVGSRPRSRTGIAAVLYIVLSGLQRGAPVLMLPFVAGAMSPDEYGASTMLTASAMVIVTIAASPLDAIVFRSGARQEEDSAANLRIAGLYCYLVAPVVCALFAGCVALFVPSFLGVGGRIWAIELLAIGFQPPLSYFAMPLVQARQDLPKFIFLSLSATVLMVSTKMLMVVIWKQGVTGWVVSDLLTAIGSAFLAVIVVRPPRATVKRSNVRALLRYTVPLIPHKASVWAIYSLNRPLMAAVSTATQVGFLSLGWNIASVAILILTEVNKAALPAYSREVLPAPTSETYSMVRYQVVLAFAVPGLIGAAVALLGEWIFSASYWEAFPLTGILLVGQAMLGIYLVPTNYIAQTAGTTRPVFIASSAGAVITFVSLMIFGRLYGALGASFAIAGGLFSMAVIATILTRVAKVEISWSSWLCFWREFLCAAATLGLSVFALALPVGSASARMISMVAILASVGAILIVYRSRSAGRSQLPTMNRS